MAIYDGFDMKLNRNSRTIQRVPTAALRLPDLVVKHHSKRQIAKVQKFLAANDQIPLVYADPSGEILFGEEIWLALTADGATDVDVMFVNGKSPHELKAIRLALHRIPMEAMWDEQNVRLALEELACVEFDLDLTGFDPPEIDNYLNLDLPKANVGENGADIPALDERPVSKPSSIWKLGKHRIGCGSGTDLAFVRRVLGGQVAATCFTDPSHNIDGGKCVSGKGARRHRELAQGTGELSDDKYFGLFGNSLSVLKACCRPSGLLYVCTDWQHVMEMTVAGRACAMPLHQIITWVKSSADTGGIYRNQSEFVCIFCAGNDAPIENPLLRRRGRYRTNVWNYPSPQGQHRAKPVALIADALRDATKRGDVVLDTFLRSGSTLMAAEETGRVCCGVEVDPRRVDVTIRRWQTATGREAVLLESGEPFNAFAQPRLAGPSETSNGG
jgi:DNA modification methylase